MENNEEQMEDNNENIAENENKSNLNTINFGKPTIYYYNTSRDNYHSKHFNKALINIILYIKLVPNNPKAYILKGKIYLNLNQFEKSLTAFLRSEKLGEKSIDLLYGLARSYKQLHQFDQALKYYKEALAIEPNAKSLNNLLTTEEGLIDLWMVSEERGGIYNFGSPIWAHISEHLECPALKGIYQIFGHTISFPKEMEPWITDEYAMLDAQQCFVLAYDNKTFRLLKYSDYKNEMG